MIHLGRAAFDPRVNRFERVGRFQTRAQRLKNPQPVQRQRLFEAVGGEFSIVPQTP